MTIKGKTKQSWLDTQFLIPPLPLPLPLPPLLPPLLRVCSNMDCNHSNKKMAPQNKVDRLDNSTNIIFNERVKYGDIQYTEDSQALDNFNQEFFSHYCNFKSRDKVYQACKCLCNKLRWYQQGIDHNKDRPSLRNALEMTKRTKTFAVKALHLLLHRLLHGRNMWILLLCHQKITWFVTFKHSL